ncbi:kinase-like domain-containing protein [Paraphysoderma sedebokerense]|nr:kinase-like domain-containing protein [Paraphysoderma sedebokerense]
MQSQPTSPVSPVGGGSTSGQPSQLNFQDFSIIKELGRGVFGIVYLADYWGTEVAIKEVFQVQDVNFQKYYEREVGMLREARHPNCIQFMGITTSGSPSTSDQKYYIVTEYVPMGNLKQWIEDHTKELSWRLKLSFAIDIARALAYLNSRGIIHRDLKGENLLITENKRIKVCDFGLSRLIPFNEEEKKRLSFCGTDAYMAPEIILCIPFDHRIDIFSYGIILCELITRRLANGITTIKRVVPGFGIDSLELKNLAPKDTPPELINLALKCCEDDPKMRPGWKDILNVLKEVEMEIIKKEVEGKGSTSKVENIGLLGTLMFSGFKLKFENLNEC